MATTGTSDAGVLKALNHPIRRRVMAMLDEGVASPKELAARLELPIPTVSYHVGILRDLGLIKVVRETPRRGAVEHHYGATGRSVSVRQVVDWLLIADQSRPPGWQARLVEFDQQAADAVREAATRFWRDIEKAEGQAAKRATRPDAAGTDRHAVAVLVTVAEA